VILEERFVHHVVSFFVPFVIFVVKPSCLKSRLHAGADIQTRHAPLRHSPFAFPSTLPRDPPEFRALAMKTLLLASWCLFCGHDPESDLRISLNHRFIDSFEFKGETRKDLINAALEKLTEKMGGREIIPKDFAGQSDEWLDTEGKELR
jgi:hypothetical protein